MGNSYFQFKKFIIHQDKTAMKVCTDACLFGAYLSKYLSAERVLDIGAGTGLLDLMYMQNNLTAELTTIEIEEDAYRQATENFEKTDWKNNITIENIALQQYKPEKKFDLILSNPPFFDNDLKSAMNARNTAMHSTQLSLDDIFYFARKHTEEYGKLALLIPFHRTEETEKIAANNSFFLTEKILVKQTTKHGYFRSILIFSRQQSELTITEIAIKNDENQYTPDFVALLKDYYLFL